MTTKPFYVAGEWRTGEGTLDVHSPYDDGVVASIYPKAEIRDNVVNYIAVVRFAPPRAGVLRPDMTATVRIETEEKR